MNKPSYAEALRIAKQVKLGLASGGDGEFVQLTAEDKRKLYNKAIRKQGKTRVDILNEVEFELNSAKAAGFDV